MILLPVLLFLLAHHILPALANVEKVIFTAPRALSQDKKGFSDWKALYPKRPSLRSSLVRAFPDTEHPQGLETWLVLDGLTEYQRYELRICWAATVSKAFHICFENTNCDCSNRLRSPLSYTLPRTCSIICGCCHQKNLILTSLLKVPQYCSHKFFAQQTTTPQIILLCNMYHQSL